MHTITRSGMSAGSSPSRCRRDAAFSPISSATARKRQLAQRGDVGLAEEVRQRLFDLLRLVDLALAQPAVQLLDGHVDVDDLVGAIEERVGHGLAHADAGDAADGVVQRLEVLDVDRRHHADAGVEQLQHVLIALLVPAARRRWCARARRRRRAPASARGWRRGPSLRASRRDSRSCRRGTTSRSPIRASVSARPCVSTNPMTTSTPSRRNACASSIIE